MPNEDGVFGPNKSKMWVEFWAGFQVFLVRRRTMELGVAGGRAAGTIWGFTAHSPAGLTGNSP